MATTANDIQNGKAYHLLFKVAGRKGDSACQLNLRLTLELKQLKLSVTDANRSLRGFEAKRLPPDFMT